jgi:hypothetical protein
VPIWACCFISTLSGYQSKTLVLRGVTSDFSLWIVTPRVKPCVLSTSHAVCPVRVHHCVGMRRKPKAFRFEPDVAQTFFILATLDTCTKMAAQFAT